MTDILLDPLEGMSREQVKKFLADAPKKLWELRAEIVQPDSFRLPDEAVNGGIKAATNTRQEIAYIVSVIEARVNHGQ